MWLGGMRSNRDVTVAGGPNEQGSRRKCRSRLPGPEQQGRRRAQGTGRGRSTPSMPVTKMHRDGWPTKGPQGGGGADADGNVMGDEARYGNPFCFVCVSFCFCLEKEDVPPSSTSGDACRHFINYSQSFLQCNTSVRLKPPS